MKLKFITLLLLAGTISSLHAQSAKDYADAYQDLQVFETPLAVKLKKGIKKSDLDKIKNPQVKQVATSLLNNQYDQKYRFAEYNAILSPSTLGHNLMIGDGYSKYENITGIYLPIGRHIISVIISLQIMKLN